MQFAFDQNDDKSKMIILLLLLFIYLLANDLLICELHTEKYTHCKLYTEYFPIQRRSAVYS